MKKLTTLLLAVIFFASCDKENNFKESSFSNYSEIERTDVNSSKGKTDIYINDREILVNHFSDNNENKTFYMPISSELTFNYDKQQITYENSEILFTRYSLLIRDYTTNHVFVFNISLPEDNEIKKSKVEYLNLNTQFSTENISIGGLSIFYEAWNIDDEAIFDNSFKTYYETSNNFRTTTACVAGGCGSSQCSEGSGLATATSQCSVTCTSGYYACCTADSRCFCISNSECGNSGGFGGGGDDNNGCSCLLYVIVYPDGSISVMVISCTGCD